MPESEPGVVFADDGMPEKRLMYEADVVDHFLDDEGIIEAVTIIERWGKSSRRRARTRDLIPENKERPSGGGYGYNTRGAVILHGTVFEVKERTDRSQWWLEAVQWGTMSDDQSEGEELSFMENNYERDWECRDCGIIYCADEDATFADLPDMCADCGDHAGWKNKKTGRIIS